MQVSQTLRVNKQVMSLKEDQKEDSFVIYHYFSSLNDRIPTIRTFVAGSLVLFTLRACNIF